MAVDTAQKRFSMMNMPNVGAPIILFEQDGAVDLDDRQHLLGCYSGIAFETPAVGGLTAQMRSTFRMTFSRVFSRVN